MFHGSLTHGFRANDNEALNGPPRAGDQLGSGSIPADRQIGEEKGDCAGWLRDMTTKKRQTRRTRRSTGSDGWDTSTPEAMLSIADHGAGSKR